MSIINTALLNALKKKKADKSNVLQLDNVTAYDPTLDYHPATKLYVDSIVAAANEVIYNEAEYVNLLGETVIPFQYNNSTYISVFYNGMLLAHDDWTALEDKSGIELTTEVLSNDDVVVVREYDSFSIADTVTQAQVSNLIEAALLANIIPAERVSYDDSITNLIATNVQTAIERLDANKIDISALSSNITLYPTTVVGDFGYFKLVDSTDSVDYNTTAVDIPIPSTGSLDDTLTDDGVFTQYVGGLIADANLFTGDPGIINVPTIGNIRRQNTEFDDGLENYYAQFYFKVFKRDASGVETLLGKSGNTPNIQAYKRPAGGYTYESFNASAIINFGTWESTDRIVIKYYAYTENVGLNRCAYEFQFGGESPVRTQVPVPITAIPSFSASAIFVDTTNFDNNLSQTDDTIQKVLEKFDDYTPELEIGSY